MRLVGREKLVTLTERNKKAAKWVTSWMAELRDAHWKRPSDVMGQFPNVRCQNDGGFVFPVPHCEIGIHVLIAFAPGVVLIAAIES